MLLAGCVLIALPLRAQNVEFTPTISSLAAPLPADDTPTGNGLITGQFGLREKFAARLCKFAMQFRPAA